MPLETFTSVLVEHFIQKHIRGNARNYQMCSTDRETADKKFALSGQFFYEIRNRQNEGLALIGYDNVTEYCGLSHVGIIPVIKQLQSVSRAGSVEKRRELASQLPRGWEIMLVEFLCRIKQEEGVKLVIFEPAQKNEYWERYMEGCSLYPDSREDHQNRMIRRYNETPKRCNFQWDESLKAFKREI